MLAEQNNILLTNVIAKQIIGKKIDNLIWWCFAIWLLVDSFNGFAVVNNIGFRPSRIFKFIVLAMVIVRLANQQNVQKILLFFVLYSLLLLVNSYCVNAQVVDTFALLMKPLSTFIFFLYFRYIGTKSQMYFDNKFWLVFVFGFVFFVGNIFLGLMGYGFSVYNTGHGTSFGVKGFLYANNEISGMIIYLFPIMLYYIYFHYSRIVYYLFWGFILFVSYSIGTKTSLAFAIISGFVITYCLGDAIEKITMVVGGIITAISGIVYLSYFMTLELDIVERFMYFYDQHGFVEAITSGRLNYWEERSEHFFRMDFISTCLGWGSREDYVCEMDPFDAILQFGYIGGVINSLFLLYLVFVPLFWSRKNQYIKIMVFCNLSLFFVSIFSGHIFFSSMAGLYIALANARLYFENKTIQN